MIIKIKSQKQKERESKVKLNFAFSPLRLNETDVIWLEFYYATIMENHIYAGRKKDFDTKEAFWCVVDDFFRYGYRHGAKDFLSQAIRKTR